MSTIEFSPFFKLSLALDGDSFVCGPAKHPFGDAERDALLAAVKSFTHVVSVPLATALSLLSHLCWVVRNNLAHPVLTPIAVTNGKKRSLHYDTVAAVCTAFLFIVDPYQDTSQSALVRFIYSFAPMSAMSTECTALSTLLAKAAVTCFIDAMRAAAFFQLQRDDVAGLVVIPQLCGLPLQWLEYNTKFLSVLRQLPTTQIVAFRELVATIRAVYGHITPKDDICDLVGAALDVAAEKPCRIADLTAATRTWLGSTPFPHTVGQAELEKLRQFDDRALAVWACGLCSTPPTPATLRPTKMLPGPEWDAKSILRDHERKRPASPSPSPKEEKKKKKVKITLDPDDID